MSSEWVNGRDVDWEGFAEVKLPSNEIYPCLVEGGETTRINGAQHIWTKADHMLQFRRVHVADEETVTFGRLCKAAIKHGGRLTVNANGTCDYCKSHPFQIWSTTSDNPADLLAKLEEPEEPEPMEWEWEEIENDGGNTEYRLEKYGIFPILRNDRILFRTAKNGFEFGIFHDTVAEAKAACERHRKENR